MGKPGLLYLLSIIFLLAACGKDKTVPAGLALKKYIDSTETLHGPERNRILDSVYASTIKPHENDSINRVLTQLVAWHYYDNGNYEKSVTVSRDLYKTASEKNDSLRMAASMFYQADYQDMQSRPDSALYYYLKAGNIYTALHDTLNAARALQNNVGILYHSGSYAKAEALAIKGIKMYKKIGDNELLFDGYLALGLILTDVKNYDTADEYFTLALAQIDKLEKEGFPQKYLTHFRASCFNNRGALFENKRDYKKAIALYNEGLAIPGVRKDLPHIYAMLISNRAHTHMLMNDTGIAVANDLWESQRIRDSLQLKPGIVSGKIRIGEFLLMKKDTARAIAYTKEGYEEARAINSTSDVLEALSQLALADRQNTSNYSNLYFRVNDSLQGAERAARDKFSRIAYETGTISEHNDLISIRFIYILVACGALILFTPGLFLILQLRARNKALLYQQEQQLANDKIYTLLMQQGTEAEKAKMQERSQIATYLDEGIISKISCINKNLALINTDDVVKKGLLEHELDETKEGIRKLSYDLKESFLTENESFAEALQQLLSKQQEASEIVFSIHIDKFVNRNTVSLEQRAAIFRIIQEACTNAKKYSGAAHCNISLIAEGTTLKLHIADDGAGFDPKKARDGIGMRNIRERVEALGGTFHNFSAPGKGTVLDIIV